jgi:hypothetical protein
LSRGIHAVDLVLHVLHAGEQLHVARLHHLLGRVDAEGQEEQARLVDVDVVLVHDADADAARVEVAPIAAGEPVGDGGAGGAGAQNDEAGHAPSWRGFPRRTILLCDNVVLASGGTVKAA